MLNELTHRYDITSVSEITRAPITWIEIGKDAFEHNIAHYKKLIAPALFAIVIKSNAYGHGMLPIAHLAQKNSAVDYICTVTVSEAILLRKSGITKPILVLSILDIPLDEVVAYDLDLVVFNLKQAQELNRLGLLYKKKISVHIKVDTGLSRLGVFFLEAAAFVKMLAQLPFLSLKGIFTHFAESEKADQSFTDLQIDRFNHVIEILEKDNILIPLKHTSCSASIISNIKSHFTMARAGIGIYGLWPSIDTKAVIKKQSISFFLKPVLTWKTKIIHIKEVSEGTFVGYNRTFRASSPLKIATIPVGYWDGYDRKLSNNGFVIINNQRAPIVGTIAMNLMMIDITGIEASLYDEVVLMGNYEGITADDLANQCSTISYEFVTRINPLLPRIVK